VRAQPPDLKHQVYYHGRRWDAPFMDGARELEHLVVSGALCEVCTEPMIDSVDDVLLFPYLTCHLECYLRLTMGSVAHLENRCACFQGIYGGGDEDLDPIRSYREGAKATMEWLTRNDRGRFLEAS
jgi:hypothetical protein